MANSYQTLSIAHAPPHQLATLHHLARQLSQQYHTHRVTQEDLKTIGLILWQTLNTDLTSTVLRIEHDTISSLTLPWECLYHPDLGFLGQHPHYTLSHYLSHSKDTLPQPLPGPLRILLFAAQPQEFTHAQLALEVEYQAIHTALKDAIAAGQVDLSLSQDGQFSTLVELLHHQAWHVVLLSGHGLLKERSPAAFVFEDKWGYGEVVPADTLAQAFFDTSVHCVIVSACQSGQAEGLAMKIAQQGIPHVIGMREPLLDRAGHVFTRTLCTALAKRTRIDVAVQQSRCAMTALLEPNETWCDHHDPSVGQWCLPRLFSQDPAVPLLDWHFYPTPRPTHHVIGSRIVLPQVFIGRRHELHVLSEALRLGTQRQLLIRGRGGIGKTALVGQLVNRLVKQLGYRILSYRCDKKISFLTQLTQALSLPPEATLEACLKHLRQEQWIIWIDGVDSVTTDAALVLYLATDKGKLVRTLWTARWKVIAAPQGGDYYLSCPLYSDFLRYVHYLGLPYKHTHLRLMYQRLHGNFKGVQLVHSLPVCTQLPDFEKQLSMVQRYLQALD